MIKDYFLRLSLNKKLVAMMLFLSLSLMAILIFLYYQTEKAMYNEFERQTSELSKAIQIGLKEATGRGGLTDEMNLQSYLERLDVKGVREISIISTSDKIISSTNPKNIGKWITKKKKELIFKAELGEPLTGEGQVYNVIIPVSAGEKTGYIHLTLNTEDFSAFMQASVIRRIIAAAFVFAIGMALAVFLARRYTRPIEDVVVAARKVADGDLDQRLYTERKDEIGQLAESFNYMVGKLSEERELKERLRKAEHLAGIGQFSRSIAHEIKNPLNFISLSIDHIKERYKPHNHGEEEKFNSLILNIKQEIQRLSRFAESFLEYGKPIEMNLRKTDMGRLIGGVLEMVSLKAKEENISILKQYGALPMLYVDPEFIKTCLYNIILNAFHAMPHGGSLTIRANVSDTKVFLSIEDTGTGIGEDRSARVFEPFFTTKDKGLGLGLALTKRIIEEHGGKVDFKSSEGKGSTITIVLPVKEEA